VVQGTVFPGELQDPSDFPLPLEAYGEARLVVMVVGVFLLSEFMFG